MNDFHDLTDAFDELERRADAAPSRTEVLTTPHATHRARPFLIAASSVAVLAVAVTVGIAASGNGDPAHQRAGGPGNIAPTLASTPAAPTPAPTLTTPTSTPGSQSIPDNPKELARLFTQVLDGLATFTVTDTGAAIVVAPPSPSSTGSAPPADLNVPPPSHYPSTSWTPPTPVPNSTTPGQTSGAGIVGMLTSGGSTGGYDIQMYQDPAGGKAWCDDAGTASCSVRTLANGSSLATGSEALQDGGVTYQATLVRPDGTTILMHVSNDRDPKGAGGQSAPRPPLTITQMTAIVTSPIWPPN